MSRYMILTALVLTLLWGTPGRTETGAFLWSDEPELRQAIKQMAAVIKEKHKEKGDDPRPPAVVEPVLVKVDGNLSTTWELGIKTAVKQMLRNEEIVVKEFGASLGVQIAYKTDQVLKRDGSMDLEPALKLRLRLLRDDKPVSGEIQAHLRGYLLVGGGKPGLLVTPDKRQSTPAHTNAVRAMLGNPDPAAVVEKTEVFAGTGGKYGVEVLVKDKPVVPVVRDGIPYVVLKPEDTFKLRLHNHAARHDAIASIKVDGIDICDYPAAENEPKRAPLPCLPLWLVERNSSTTIRGWCASLKETEEFRVVEAEKSVLGRVGYNENTVHAITVAFGAAWKDEEEIPVDEPAPIKAGQHAIGTGKLVPDEKKVVTRRYGLVREIVVIRYEVPTP